MNALDLMVGPELTRDQAYSLGQRLIAIGREAGALQRVKIAQLGDNQIVVGTTGGDGGSNARVTPDGSTFGGSAASVVPE